MTKLSGPINLIKQSFNLFFKRKNIIPLILVYLPLVPFSLLSLFKFQDNWQAWVLAGAGLTQILVSSLVIPAAIVLMGGMASGDTVSLRDSFKFAGKVYFKFLLLSVIISFINTLGFILLIIPGVLFMVWFYFAQFILVKENSGIKMALSKSKRLVKGKFWKVLGRMVVFGCFSALFQIIFSLIPFEIGSILLTISGALFVLPSYLLYQELVSVDNI